MYATILPTCILVINYWKYNSKFYKWVIFYTIDWLQSIPSLPSHWQCLIYSETLRKRIAIFYKSYLRLIFFYFNTKNSFYYITEVYKVESNICSVNLLIKVKLNTKTKRHPSQPHPSHSRPTTIGDSFTYHNSCLIHMVHTVFHSSIKYFMYFNIFKLKF